MIIYVKNNTNYTVMITNLSCLGILMKMGFYFEKYTFCFYKKFYQFLCKFQMCTLSIKLLLL